MLTYHILYNPHAGSGRGQEATYRLNVLLPDDRLLFRFTSVLLFRVLAHPVKNRTIIMMPATVGSINGFPEACHFTPGRLQSFPVFIQFLF